MSLFPGWAKPLACLPTSNIAPSIGVYRTAESGLHLSFHELVRLVAIYHYLSAYGILLLGCVALYRATTKLGGRVRRPIERTNLYFKPSPTKRLRPDDPEMGPSMLRGSRRRDV